MRFEELAFRAGKTAATVGSRAERPPFGQVISDRTRRILNAGWSTTAALGIVILGIVLIWPAPRGSSPAAEVPATTTPSAAVIEEVPASCPITASGANAFTPASEAPDGPPSVYEAVWYGTPDLWTMIEPNGEVWRDLPVGTDGDLAQKTLWLSEHLSSGESAEISLTAEHLNGSAPTVEVSGPCGASSSPSSPSFGIFMVVGFELPQQGCWEITAEYKGATLSYVVWVDNA